MSARKHHILYQLVAPMEQTLGAAEMVRRREFLQEYAASTTVVDIRSVQRGTASIESAYDAAIVAPYILASIEERSAADCDAVIIGCFSDPAIDAARETSTIPVVGPGMSAINLALQLGDRFSVISPNSNGSGRIDAYVRQLGLGARHASTRGMGLSVVELAKKLNDPLQRVSDVAQRCVEEDGADVIVMGCMSMAFLDITKEVSQRCGVPVISPVIAALKTAEMMLAHGVSHSRTSWPTPPKKPVLERG